MALSAALFATLLAVVVADASPPSAGMPDRQLLGLTANEATTLLATLEEAQRALREGRFQAFELRSGAPASYRETEIAPRAAFLSVPFRQVWQVERIATNNRLWQPYRIKYAPEGLGKRFWDIEVVVGFNGGLEQVTMTYKPPAPF